MPSLTFLSQEEKIHQWQDNSMMSSRMNWTLLCILDGKVFLNHEEEIFSKKSILTIAGRRIKRKQSRPES
jgi:hypothetical protein